MITLLHLLLQSLLHFLSSNSSHDYFLPYTTPAMITFLYLIPEHKLHFVLAPTASIITFLHLILQALLHFYISYSSHDYILWHFFGHLTSCWSKAPPQSWSYLMTKEQWSGAGDMLSCHWLLASILKKINKTKLYFPPRNIFLIYN